tara:strand:- start:816 stop:1034 length:219 start_codon:yes stop_codon:yes gene_type:complete
MKLHTETNLLSFDAWSGAVETKGTIIDNNKADDFDSLIEELYPDGLSETALNDLLWFDDAFIFEALGIRETE